MTTITITQTFTSKTRNGGGGGAIPPSNTVAPLLSGTPTVGQTLSCSTGTWLGTLPITYTYQWRRGVSNILGATSSTYTLVQADASFAVTCIVTATNAAGSADSTSNSLTIFDADAQAFITAAGITDNTQKTAINTLVVDMKGFGIWTKMKAIYPFVGGTATTHKYNLKDPQDLDAAFRLVFLGGWTHSSTGALPNGTNGYADTKCNMSTNYSVNTSVHISYYSRTDGSFTSQDMAVYNGTTFTALTIRRSAFSNQTLFAANETINYSFSAADPNGAAFYISNRTALNINNGWRNSTKVATGTNTAGTRPNLNMFLANININGAPDAGLYGKRECAFASIGDGLTDTDASNFYTAVQAFNTTLGRQV
jgi:hypothetical protein